MGGPPPAPVPIRPANSAFAVGAPGLGIKGAAANGDDDDGEGDGDDEQLDAMDEDEMNKMTSQAQLDRRVLTSSFTPLQNERFEAYRRATFNRQAVRKLIHQGLGLTVSPQIAQVVGGMAKVFVGEIVEKAKRAQDRRGGEGPISPDDLREAYREYVEEHGSVGATRASRGKRLFVR
ncbi:hTAFII28-like protein conserved region-domain-containing protein [Auriculariales sp. MPI-PUGE-AT-0066]|nr:hTAFII28-like protein conserved region-domain-containing protein [Auriculariales sp. MPI-PUGE-AT-0066]